ncbi:hypothetical protein HBH58_184550 [Parastagonospora nodorum]|nr:hypothetical protein HBH58_184550 [Parastagonospora nodorum]
MSQDICTAFGITHRSIESCNPRVVSEEEKIVLEQHPSKHAERDRGIEIGPYEEYRTTDKQELERIRDGIGLCMSTRFDALLMLTHFPFSQYLNWPLVRQGQPLFCRAWCKPPWLRSHAGMGPRFSVHQLVGTPMHGSMKSFLVETLNLCDRISTRGHGRLNVPHISSCHPSSHMYAAISTLSMAFTPLRLAQLDHHFRKGATLAERLRFLFRHTSDERKTTRHGSHHRFMTCESLHDDMRGKRIHELMFYASSLGLMFRELSSPLHSAQPGLAP